MFILFDVYIFIAWIGAWSTYSGFHALVIAAVWTLFMILAIIGSLFGGAISFLLTISGKWKTPVVIALMSWILYFCGLGDWLTGKWPNVFPQGGYMFTEASAAWFEHVILWCWVLFRLTPLRFLV